MRTYLNKLDGRVLRGHLDEVVEETEQEQTKRRTLRCGGTRPSVRHRHPHLPGGHKEGNNRTTRMKRPTCIHEHKNTPKTHTQSAVREQHPPPSALPAPNFSPHPPHFCPTSLRPPYPTPLASSHPSPHLDPTQPDPTRPDPTRPDPTRPDPTRLYPSHISPRPYPYFKPPGFSPCGR